MEQIDTVEPISNCSDLYKDTHWMQYPPHLTTLNGSASILNCVGTI